MKENKSFFSFFAVSTLFSMAASFAHPVTPTIIEQRGFGDYMFGVALASMMTVNFLFSPFWGQLVSYLSSRRILLICCLGYALGQALFGLASSEGMMVAARMFAGLFTGGIFTAQLTYLVNCSPGELRNKHLTVTATIQTVASAFGFFIGGMLGEISIGLAIVMQVIVLASCSGLFYLVCRDDASKRSRAIKPTALFREANPVAAFIAGSRIMTPLLVSLFAVAALANLGNSGFDQSFNYYLKAQLGLSSGYNGAIKAMIGLISLAANSTICLWLIRKTDIRRSSIAVYLFCSTAMLGVVLVNATVPFVITNVIYFGLFAISVPLTQSLVANAAKGKDSNLTMGFYNGLKSLGGIFGSLAAGLLYTVNPKWPFILGMAAFICATLLAAVHYQLGRRADLAQSEARQLPNAG